MFRRNDHIGRAEQGIRARRVYALAGKLSGLAQGGGYTLAALGPLGVGVMLQLGLGLDAITAVLMTVCALAGFFALFAGRNRRLEVDNAGRVVTR